MSISGAQTPHSDVLVVLHQDCFNVFIPSEKITIHSYLEKPLRCIYAISIKYQLFSMNSASKTTYSKTYTTSKRTKWTSLPLRFEGVWLRNWMSIFHINACHNKQLSCLHRCLPFIEWPIPNSSYYQEKRFFVCSHTRVVLYTQKIFSIQSHILTSKRKGFHCNHVCIIVMGINFLFYVF